ncbi:MAG: arginase family protein, partial [Microvirgula sp.]
TPFRQIADDCAARGWPFHYACLGIAAPSNTAALFARARELGVQWVDDQSMRDWHPAILGDFIDRVDAIHLSIDLDVLPASVAPGVSAPAAFGVELAVIERIAAQVRASGKLRLAELAELNPRLDIDSHTARIAARLAFQLL